MMKKTHRTPLISALLLTGTLIITGSSFAKDFSMHEKLQQCENAYEKMKNANMSQADAWKARKQHKQLVSEILSKLNKRNADVSTATGEELSGAEILNNFKVMGRLLEMLAAEHPSDTDEWGYSLE